MKIFTHIVVLLLVASNAFLYYRLGEVEGRVKSANEVKIELTVETAKATPTPKKEPVAKESNETTKQLCSN